MATPYIKKPFSIASGATASGDIYVDELSGEYCVARIQIIGALTANTASIDGADSIGGTFFSLYDEFDSKIQFNVQGNRMYRVRPSDYPVFNPVLRIGLGSAASGAVTGFVWLRKVS